MTGQTLGRYRIEEKLGEGGMGVVYRGHDTTLARDVAIKVLPEAFARDPDRLARFKREAQLLASLNHPNIAAIHGLEEQDGVRYLVLELVPGRTLADRVGAAPTPMAADEALRVCRQVAEALEAAHEKGIVHRDLKPANVKLTPEGQGAGLRPGQSLRGRRFRGRSVALTHHQHGRHARRGDPGHRRLHEPGAGAGQDGGQARRHLGLRLPAL